MRSPMLLRRLAAALAAVLLVLGLSAALPALRPLVLPGLGGALVTLAVGLAGGLRPTTLVLAAVLAGLAAVAVDQIALHVLGAGYPAVRALRAELAYPAAVALGFGVLALFDLRPGAA